MRDVSSISLGYDRHLPLPGRQLLPFSDNTDCIFPSQSDFSGNQWCQRCQNVLGAAAAILLRIQGLKSARAPRNARVAFLVQQPSPHSKPLNLDTYLKPQEQLKGVLSGPNAKADEYSYLTCHTPPMGIHQSSINQYYSHPIILW